MQFIHFLQIHAASGFLSGMDPLISSRHCSLQQSSVDCRDQYVRRKMSLQNVSALVGMHVTAIGCLFAQYVLHEYLFKYT